MAIAKQHDNRFFAAMYDRCARSAYFQHDIDPWRAQLAAQARGVVLEIGAGGGQNFAFYDPAVTERVVATEPNAFMRQRAMTAIASSRVPIELVAAPAETLPFAEASFDTVFATLVFCSVDNPMRALGEIARVLKPGGALLLFEHVRSPRRVWATVQNVITPFQRRLAANCHLNRDTAATVRAAGFTITSEEWSGGGAHPLVAIIAKRA